MSEGNGAQELAGTAAVVTGSNRNIGRGIALALADAGAAVVINAHLSRDLAEGVANEIAEAGGRAIALDVDISKEDATLEMAEQVHGEFGQIDVLLNNAAIYYDQDINDQSIEYLRRNFDVNLIGQLLCARAVFPYMKEAGSGSIINISSRPPTPSPSRTWRARTSAPSRTV